MNNEKDFIQLVWSIALILMGIGLFIFGPDKMEQNQLYIANPTFFKICLYFISGALILGGVKKILQIKKKDDI